MWKIYLFFADTHIFRKTANITRGSYRKVLAIHTVNIGLERSRSHKEFDWSSSLNELSFVKRKRQLTKQAQEADNN